MPGCCPCGSACCPHAGPRSESHLPRLVQVLEPCLDGLDGAWLARIEAASNAHPREARLQYLAGMACVQRQLWGKAQQLLLRAAPTCRKAHCAPAPGSAWP